jgi:hypothetical protein
MIEADIQLTCAELPQIRPKLHIDAAHAFKYFYQIKYFITNSIKVHIILKKTWRKEN